MESETQDAKDGRARDNAEAAAWAHDGLAADFGERGDEPHPHLAAFRNPSERQPLRARVKLSANGKATLVTVEPSLRDGDVIYVESQGTRKGHRISGMRRGLRSRDPQELRIAVLAAIDD
jgi:hypothetical protein